MMRKLFTTHLIVLTLVIFNTAFALSFKALNMDAGIKINGYWDTYRYLSVALERADSLWILGYQNESSLIGLVGQYQEYRVYAHRYGTYPLLPQWENIVWFVGASLAGSQFAEGIALSPDLGLRTLQTQKLFFVPYNFSEDLSFYTNALQSKTQLEILPWMRPWGWPIAIVPEVNYLWFGPLVGSVSGSLGVGLQVRVRWE